MATIELILTEDIHRLGNAGDVVRVKAGFGRNYLLPQGKAMLAAAEARSFGAVRPMDPQIMLGGGRDRRPDGCP